MSVVSLLGKKGLVVGIANADSLAWAVARSAQEAGAELALTYLNDKARQFVAPLAERIGAPPSRDSFSTSTERWPTLASACAAASPAGPPPTIRIGRLMPVSRWGCNRAPR